MKRKAPVLMKQYCQFSKVKKWCITLSIQLLIITYLLFFMVCFLTTPTTAYFKDEEKIQGTISAAKRFNNNQKQSNEYVDIQPDKNQDADKQARQTNLEAEQIETSMEGSGSSDTFRSSQGEMDVKHSDPENSISLEKDKISETEAHRN